MNVYEPLDIDRLRDVISQTSVLNSASQSGFRISSVDQEQVTVFWQNVGSDEHRHRDEAGWLVKYLNQSGYEARLTKPANTTLIVRQVQPIVVVGSAFEGRQLMGPFETSVDSMFLESLIRIPASVRNRLNGKIAEVASGNPIARIPLTDIDDILRSEGYLLVQEDGTKWAGILTGRDGKAKIDIGLLSTEDENGIYEMVNSLLFLTWHKFDTGRWEVIAYVS